MEKNYSFMKKWFNLPKESENLKEEPKDIAVYKISKLNLGENIIKAWEITDEFLFIRVPYGVGRNSMIMEYYIPLEDLRKALLKED